VNYLDKYLIIVQVFVKKQLPVLGTFFLNIRMHCRFTSQLFLIEFQKLSPILTQLYEKNFNP
jgi:hypothetical protein